MRKQLSAAFVRNIKTPGKYGDLHGLILRVRETGSKQWIWRGTVRGKRVDLGLGGYPYTTLAEARQKAFDYRKLSRQGDDPRTLRDTAPTFEEAARKVLAIHRKTWKPGGGSEEQWRVSMTRYALPHLGRRRVTEITPADVMATLLAGDLWTDKPVTASRVRQRVSAVMKWAIAQGHRQDNPAGEALGAALPKHNGRKKHFKALPPARVAGAIATVQASGAWVGTKLAFEFLVLTASPRERGAVGDVGRVRPRRRDLDAACVPHEGGQATSGPIVPPGTGSARRGTRALWKQRSGVPVGEGTRDTSRGHVAATAALERRSRSPRISVELPGLVRRDRRRPHGGRTLSRPCRAQPSRSRLRPLRSVRAAPEGHGAVGGIPSSSPTHPVDRGDSRTVATSDTRLRPTTALPALARARDTYETIPSK